MSDIKIVIGADIKNLQSELAKAGGVTKEFAAKSQSSVVKLGGAFTQLAASGQKSIFILKESLKELQAGVFTEKDTTKIKLYNAEISKTQAEIKKLESAGVAGFGAIGAGVNKAYGSIRTIANILPGLGISTIFLLGYEAVVKLLSGLDLFSGSLTRAKQAKDILNEAMSGSKSGYTEAVKNVQELTINIDLAKQGFLSKEQVLKQYNDTIGKTTGQVNTLDEAERQLVKNGPAYVQMMLYKAAAQIALEQAAKKVVAAQIEFDKQQRISTDLIRKGQAEQDKAAGAGGLSEFLSKGIKNEANKAKVEAEKASLQLQDIALQFQKDAANIAKSFGFEFFDSGNGLEKIVRNVRSIQDVLSDLKAQQEFISKSNILIGTEKAQANISALKSAFDELLKNFKLSTTNPVIVKLAFEINKAESQQETDALLARTEKVVTERSVGKEIKPKIIVQPKLQVDQAVLKTDAEILGQKVSDILTNTLVNTLSGIGELIAEAVSTGDISKGFEGIIKTIGAGLKEIGKALIQYGLKAVILKNIGKLNPYLAIVSGIALVALGSVLQSQVGKVKGFAGGSTAIGEGGVFEVGERGKELIRLPRGASVVPNHEVNAYSGGGVTLQPSILYEGSGFRIMLNRVDASNRRNN